MKEITFQDYLELLKQLTHILEELTAIERKKTQAVCQDDLLLLSECMKQEQAMTLTLRGLDRKREAMLAEIELKEIPLSKLSEKAPVDERLNTKQIVEDLHRQYTLFRGTADVARDTLEINLHEIEKMMRKLDRNHSQSHQDKLPSNIRTDFKV